MLSKQAVDYAKSQVLELFGQELVPDLQLHACERHEGDTRWVVVLSYASPLEGAATAGPIGSEQQSTRKRQYKKVFLMHNEPKVVGITTHETEPDTKPR